MEVARETALRTGANYSSGEVQCQNACRFAVGNDLRARIPWPLILVGQASLCGLFFKKRKELIPALYLQRAAKKLPAVEGAALAMAVYQPMLAMLAQIRGLGMANFARMHLCSWPLSAHSKILLNQFAAISDSIPSLAVR